MLWEVTGHGAGAEILDRTHSIEADNWYLALREYLNRNDTSEQHIASLTCTVQSDGTVRAHDLVTEQQFTLVPLAQADVNHAVETPSTVLQAPADIPSDILCELVFDREEPPAQEPGIRYIEHRYVTTQRLSRETAQSLVLAKFLDLKARDVSKNEKLFINVQLFGDTADVSNRTPEVSLLWKEWEDHQPRICFFEDETDGQPSLLSSNQVSTMSDHNEKPPKGTNDNDTDNTESKIDDLVVTAFERIQGLFAIRDHRSAATFVLSLARDLSSCEGGLCLLERSGKAPAEVHKDDTAATPPPIREELDLQRGIVGFATRNGAAIHVVDPQNDPRCIDDLDLAGGTPPRNLLCVPLQHEGHTIGALLFWDAPGDAGFSRSGINALSYIAGALAEHIAVSLPARDGEYFADEPPPQRKSEPPKRISLIPLPFFKKSKS